jgi:outer membrane protein W
MRITCVVLATSLACSVAAPVSLAQESAWTLRFHGAIVDSSSDADTSVDGGFSSRVDVGGGLGIGAEVRLSERLGLEISTLFAGLEVGMKASANQGSAQNVEMSMIPLTFGLPIHFDSGKRVDFFVAPTLSVVSYTDVRTSFDRSGAGSRVDVDTDIGLGAALGLDVPFGKRGWAFSTGLRYMKTRAQETDVDPLIVMVGFAHRF